MLIPKNCLYLVIVEYRRSKLGTEQTVFCNSGYMVVTEAAVKFTKHHCSSSVMSVKPSKYRVVFTAADIAADDTNGIPTFSPPLN